MKQSRYGLLGVAAFAAVLAACKEDPLADSGGSLQGVDLQFSYLEVVIGDSVRTFAIERDALNTPLPPTATVRSCNTGITTVAPVSDAPQQRTGFFVRGETFGTTCVIVEAGDIADTMEVATFPAQVLITGGDDSVTSGSTLQFGFRYLSARGVDVTNQGIPAPTWSTSDTLVGTVTQAGVLSGFNPGVVTVRVGSPRGPGTDEVSFTQVVFVDPLPFRGTTSALTGVPTDTVRFARAVGAPRFNQGTDLTVSFKFLAIRSFVARKTADSLYVIVPGVGDTTTSELVLTRADSAKTAEKVSFRATTRSLADHYDATNGDPSTAPAITANGDYYIVLSGVCPEGAGGPTDDCDDFFRVANPSATDTLFASVRADWFTGSDVDILWCRNAGCTSVTTGGGATAANPEVSNVKIPPGATWFLWLNNFDPAGAQSIITRVRFSGLP